MTKTKGFNPRTPCGVRPTTKTGVSGWTGFQSTHSLRSATARQTNEKPAHEVSIHALLAECDINLNPPATMIIVSIHALLAECDSGLISKARPSQSFNPRTPCGVRPGNASTAYRTTQFQSTHSLRSATSLTPRLSRPSGCFNPRTPCGVRPSRSGQLQRHAGFNPRTPCGVRLTHLKNLKPCTRFQSTHSLRSATAALPALPAQPDRFNPRTPCGVRPWLIFRIPVSTMFQSTHSLRSATLSSGSVER